MWVGAPPSISSRVDPKKQSGMEGVVLLLPPYIFLLLLPDSFLVGKRATQ